MSCLPNTGKISSRGNSNTPVEYVIVSTMLYNHINKPRFKGFNPFVITKHPGKLPGPELKTQGLSARALSHQVISPLLASYTEHNVG
ncbi:hypothetical protein CEXT_57671 [Caerostris extrusa]|uniref:Uncharacterized protein n=1 Tax=Caerostris extrusa TaxID=172846 RepID=A0AAV4NPR3_CAEEX|nr:hypothetical protein CEXT_57671 [Caerostris extrusa]